MITKPTENDSFGYDDAGLPVAVKLDNNVYAYGYDLKWS